MFFMTRAKKIIKLLALATFVWALFFLNLILPKVLKNAPVGSVLLDLFYVVILVVALVSTLILIAESLKKERPVLKL